MSKFNSYAKKADQIAKAAFEEYRKAEEDYKKAAAAFSEYPAVLNGNVGAAYMAKKARAEADYLQAKEDMKAAKAAFASHKAEFRAMRQELEAELNDYYAADPAALDSNTLELLKSGILKTSDYTRLMNAAQESNNHTMARVIAKYASDAAAEIGKRYGENSPQARELRAVGYAASQNSGDDHLQAFDSMANLYDRCVNNPAMIDHWDEIAAETIENF